MQFRNSSIWKDVQSVLTAPLINYSGDWSLSIHTAKQNIPALKVLNIDFRSDFVNEVTDVVIVSFMISRATYLHNIYPHLDNLEVILTKYAHNSPDNAKSITKPVFQDKYKAIYLPEHNHRPKGTKDQMIDYSGLDLLPPITMNLQLMSLNAEPLRLKMVEGVLKGYPNTASLTTLVTNELSKISLPTGKVIDKVDIQQADNTTPVKHVIIPSGTNLMNLPTVIHEQMMGYFNSGMGTYVTKTKNLKTKKMESHYYVYPTHSPVKSRPSLHLFVVPDYELGMNDSTFMIAGNTIKIIGHIEGSYKEDRQTNSLEHGIGFRQPHAAPYMTKPVTMTAAGPVGSEQKLNYKVATTSRSDGFNMANRAHDLTSANPYKQYSNFVKQVGNYVNFVWQESDRTLLQPSMAVIYIL